MNSVYDVGNQIDIKNLLAPVAVAVGDNKTDVIEVNTNKIYTAGSQTSTDYEVYAGASGIVIILDKDVLKVDSDTIQIELQESDDTTAANFLPVIDDQVSITNLITKETGLTQFTGNTAEPMTNSLSIFVKYNGFKKYIMLNVKGVGTIGGGKMNAVIFMSHLDNQHGPIQWYPKNS